MLFAIGSRISNLTPSTISRRLCLRPRSTGVPHEALSDDLELLRSIFREKSFRWQPAYARDGDQARPCVGVVQWIRIELDRQTSYDNARAQRRTQRPLDASAAPFRTLIARGRPRRVPRPAGSIRP